MSCPRNNSIFYVISPLQRSFECHRILSHHGSVLRVFKVKNQGFPDCFSIRDCIIFGRTPMSGCLRRAKAEESRPEVGASSTSSSEKRKKRKRARLIGGTCPPITASVKLQLAKAIHSRALLACNRTRTCNSRRRNLAFSHIRLQTGLQTD